MLQLMDGGEGEGGELYTLGTRATHITITGRGFRLDTGHVVQGGNG